MLHSLADFRRQLDILQDRCQIVDAAGFLRARKCEGHAKSSVLLTFDDGYADFFTIAIINFRLIMIEIKSKFFLLKNRL
jgi:hypothetical protein